MRRTLLSVGLVAGLVGCRGGSALPSEDEPDPGPVPSWSADMQAVADGGNRFACDLYGKLRDEKGNLFLSPYSVHTALAMTAAGAAGPTRDQMVRVLHLPADRDRALAAGDVGRYYAAPRAEYELGVANGLWGQAGAPWRPDFLAVQQDRFGAGFREADFAADPDAARRRINRWVEEHTRDKIKDLLAPPDITGDTRMVLANAIYFKGKWADEFKKSQTDDGPFRLSGGGTVSVPFMHRTGRYVYGEGDGFQVLQMPYRGRELAMVIILPRERDGLPGVETRLTAEILAGWVGKLSAEEVRVTVPRFRLEYRFEPAEQLRALGLTAAFDPDVADFTGMAETKLFISKVVHKAFVDVNEEGTEAAAATGVAMMKSAEVVHDMPKVFTADHSFLFLIRDAARGTILFMGRVTNPKG